MVLFFAPKFGALNHYTYIMERNSKTLGLEIGELTQGSQK